jgi:SNF2 family DNA or RNA helicase
VDFYQHQIDAVRQLHKRRSFILGDDMGLGKSLEAIALFAVDVKRGWAETCIIVTLTTLRGNWADELKKFTRFPFFVLEGAPDERIWTFAEYMVTKGPKILIMSYEQAILHKVQLDAHRFDIAIFDEAHAIKDPRSARTRAVLDIRSRRSFMLTGTPMENRVDELWCLLHRVDPERYYSHSSFVNRHAQFGGYQGRQIVGTKNEKELVEKVQSVMLRRTKDEVLDLPEVQIVQRRVDLHPEQRALYKEVDEDLRLVWADSDEPEMIEWTFVKVMRLRQICGTLTRFTGEDISAKLDLAIQDDTEILEHGEKIVVFTQDREVHKSYMERALTLGVPLFGMTGETRVPDRVPLTKRWAEVSGPAILCAMQQVAYAGLTLTASRHGSFLDKHYNPQKNQQAIDRMHRIGSDLTRPVQIREYLCRKTVETRVEAINRNKKKLFKDIIDSGGTDWKRTLIKMLTEAGDDDDD